MTTLEPSRRAPAAGASNECSGALPEVLIDAQSVVPGYGQTPVMPPAQWCIRRGEVWALVGDNGTGKTSLLRTLLDLQPSYAGQLIYRDNLIVAYMAQVLHVEARLPMRVFEYVLGGAERAWSFLKPWGAAQSRGQVRVLSQKLGFADLLDMPLHALSEGQKQRVSLGRALMTQPDVLVLDEPTSAMDMASETLMLGRLKILASEHHMAIVVVGHHLSALFRATSHWAWLPGGGQALVQGPRDQVAEHPAFAARYGALMTQGCDAPGPKSKDLGR